MKTHIIAKVFGWGQFLVQLLGQAAQGGVPHGVAGWAGLFGSLVAAMAIHAASNTAGTT